MILNCKEGVRKFAFAKTSPSAVDAFFKEEDWNANPKWFVESWQLVLVTMSVWHESQLTPGNISSFQRTSWENVARPEVYWFEFEHN